MRAIAKYHINSFFGVISVAVYFDVWLNVNFAYFFVISHQFVAKCKWEIYNLLFESRQLLHYTLSFKTEQNTHC